MHPHFYVAIMQLEQDRRRDLEQGLHAAAARTRARPRTATWRRAVRSVRRLVTQPAT